MNLPGNLLSKRAVGLDNLDVPAQNMCCSKLLCVSIAKFRDEEARSPEAVFWGGAMSNDGGATWETNWTMDFERAG